MRVILDECLPRRLVRDLKPHAVTTVPREGWSGIKNGALLKLVATDFDIFITVDSNLIHQQNLTGMNVCVIVLRAINNRYETLQPLLPEIMRAISDHKPGTIVRIGL